MKRCVRLLALCGALLVTTGVFAAQGREELRNKIATLKKKAAVRAQQETLAAAAPVAEEGFFATRASWLNNMIESWKGYLAQPAQADYLVAKTGEEFSFNFVHEWSNHSYDHVGARQTPATVGFGQAAFPLRDAFAASNLLMNEHVHAVKQVDQAAELTNNSQHYLALLGNQQIAFDSHYSRQELNLNLERRFLGDRLAVRVSLPLVRQAHRLALSKEACITRSNRSALVDVTSMNSQLVRSAMGVRAQTVEAPPFYQQYNDMGDFLHQVLKSGGIAMKKSQEEVSLGDISLAAEYHLALPYVDECVVGANVQLGTAKGRRNVALWEPTLGNEATKLSVQAQFALHRGVYANPFFNVRMSYNVPVRTARRVPFRLSHDGASHFGERMVQAMPRTIFFSDTMNLSGAAFDNQPETRVRDLASTVHKVTLNKGLELDISMGNSVERCFGKPLFVSFVYDLHLGQSHSLSSVNNTEFATEVVTQNTFTFGSTIGGTIGYHINENCRAQGGCAYRFAGRNMQGSVRCNAELAFRF